MFISKNEEKEELLTYDIQKLGAAICCISHTHTGQKWPRSTSGRGDPLLLSDPELVVLTTHSAQCPWAAGFKGRRRSTSIMRLPGTGTFTPGLQMGKLRYGMACALCPSCSELGPESALSFHTAL